MNIINFETRKYVQRLEQDGIPHDKAVAWVDEAFALADTDPKLFELFKKLTDKKLTDPNIRIRLVKIDEAGAFANTFVDIDEMQEAQKELLKKLNDEINFIEKNLAKDSTKLKVLRWAAFLSIALAVVLNLFLLVDTLLKHL